MHLLSWKASRQPNAIASKHDVVNRGFCTAGKCFFGMLDRLLSVSDSSRAFDLLKRLGQHCIEPWALTGGLAIEIHLLLARQTPQRRSLNDLDFIASRFAD